jgi:hypothetical protein
VACKKGETYLPTSHFQAQTILKALIEDDNVQELVLIAIACNTDKIEYCKSSAVKYF